MFSLTVRATSQTVNVPLSYYAFDKSQTFVGDYIDRDRIEELPIPNRNYLSFVALSPQASPANPATAQQSGSQTNLGFGSVAFVPFL